MVLVIADCNDGVSGRCNLHDEWRALGLRLRPTLKKLKDDMTKAGLPVNMLAVHRTAVLAGDFVSQ
jgi:hypothetical protein